MLRVVELEGQHHSEIPYSRCRVIRRIVTVAFLHRVTLTLTDTVTVVFLRAFC